MSLGPAELLALAQAAGTGGDPSTAAAIALAESGGDPAAIGTNQDGSRDRGVWQINDKAHPDVSDGCAFDAGCNARAAYAISNGWTDFTPWTTFNNGAYLQFVQQVSTADQAEPPARSLQGQSVVGQTLTAPWFQGTWEITQGWGPTDYAGEPEGHGYQHWHAGVDVGVACGTIITFPAAGMAATARSFDNPDGYGTAMVLLIDNGPAILLGHLRQRLVDDGTRLQGGEEIAISNNTGNSTGCHLHFEVRPQDPKRPLGMAAYGTDVDPSTWLVSGPTGSANQLLATTASGPSLGEAIGLGLQTLLNGAEILLGAGTLLAGLIATAYGLSGRGATDLRRDAGRQARKLARPRRRSSAPRPAQPVSEPAESRIRPDLQQRRPQ